MSNRVCRRYSWLFNFAYGLVLRHSHSTWSFLSKSPDSFHLLPLLLKLFRRVLFLRWLLRADSMPSSAIVNYPSLTFSTLPFSSSFLLSVASSFRWANSSTQELQYKEAHGTLGMFFSRDLHSIFELLGQRLPLRLQLLWSQDQPMQVSTSHLENTCERKKASNPRPSRNLPLRKLARSPAPGSLVLPFQTERTIDSTSLSLYLSLSLSLGTGSVQPCTRARARTRGPERFLPSRVCPLKAQLYGN